MIELHAKLEQDVLDYYERKVGKTKYIHSQEIFDKVQDCIEDIQNRAYDLEESIDNYILDCEEGYEEEMQNLKKKGIHL